MRSSSIRSIGIATFVIVLVALIASTGSHRPSIVASGAMRQLQPRMSALDIARESCRTRAKAPCSAAAVAATPAGMAMDLRVGSACIAPRAACVHTDGDIFIAEIVSRELPGIGGIRLEGRAHRDEPRLQWTCHPVRGVSDAAIVDRACGDVPRS
jgi:hypothetical protein